MKYSGYKYARGDISDVVPLKNWVCYFCDRKPIKKVRLPGSPGMIALCDIHLKEFYIDSNSILSRKPKNV